MEIREEKAILRRESLARRDSLKPEERRRKNAEILSRILALPEYSASETVLAYCGFGGELQTHGLLREIIDSGKRLLLPRVARETNSLILHEVEAPESQLTPGIWGIPEPGAGLPTAAPEEADFILVPGVAFDRGGGRLGYGGGYYDRLLGGLPVTPPLISAAFEVQVTERVPSEAHDIRVDSLVTENEVFRFGCRRSG